MKCTVVENVKGIRKKGPLHLIRFTTDKHIEFEPGDLVDVTVDTFPKRNRQFSIAGHWPDGTYDFIIRDAGSVGNHLCNAKEGDTFTAEFIGGMFHPTEKAIWISSGSGMAPFRAAILIGKSAGARYFCKLDADDELDEIVGPVGDAHCIYDSSYEGQKTTLESHIDLTKNLPIFVCGSSRYVTEICSFLSDLGIDSKYIETDIYGAATD
jgi:ferredoxin-NADP reductase